MLKHVGLTNQVIEFQARSFEQPGHLLRGDGGILDDEPVHVLQQHQSMRHPCKLGDLFGSSICRRDDI